MRDDMILCQQKVAEVLAQVNQIVIGKEECVRKVMAAILAGGHILLEDIPGVGKTTLAMAFSETMALQNNRLQFTPDVMPSDLLGFSMYQKQTGTFEYQTGAVMCNLFLGDEINRTSPKTQSALLEVMEEGNVTVDGVTRKVPEPFVVIATENPAGSVGTQLLPESQLDRFMIQLSLGYPEEEAELDLLERYVKKGNTLSSLQAVCDAQTLLEMRQACEQVTVHRSILEYARNIAKRTREEKKLALGVSTRGVIALISMARAYAAVCGEEFVTPDRIKELAPLVYAHRIISEDPFLTQRTTKDVMRDLIKAVEVPTEDVL